MFAIIGSGFGLYGYLPCLVDWCAQRIVLPERYRARFGERPELARFAGDIEWEANEGAALDQAEGVVIAQRPIDQCGWIHRCLARENIRRLVVEKPLAQSPEAARETLDQLIHSGRIFRIGYIFRYTGWGQTFLQTVGRAPEGDLVSIRWEFLADHFRRDLQNWKRFTAAGGGAIRFYGIQMIALLAEASYRDVVVSHAYGTSADEIDKWIARLEGPGLPECEVIVDTRSTVNSFRVRHISRSGESRGMADLDDPFDGEATAVRSSDLDRRVGLLGQMCRALWEASANEHEWYDATIRLWRTIEENTRFEPTSLLLQRPTIPDGNQWPV